MRGSGSDFQAAFWATQSLKDGGWDPPAQCSEVRNTCSWLGWKQWGFVGHSNCWLQDVPAGTLRRMSADPFQTRFGMGCCQVFNDMEA